MDANQKAIHQYCADHSSSPLALLHELERETHLKTLAPQMMSGRLQGQFLHLLCKIHQPKQVLEIGTFTGYAAICMASALSENARLTTIEVNEELAPIINKYIEEANLESTINLLIGDAKEVIPALRESFDLVFIDAGKRDYQLYYDLILDKLNVGGLILIDNVLWSGKVVRKERDLDTQSLMDFNRMIQHDPRVENIILPLRDGLTIVRKK